jgi:hypothetical protein
MSGSSTPCLPWCNALRQSDPPCSFLSSCGAKARNSQCGELLRSLPRTACGLGMTRAGTARGLGMTEAGTACGLGVTEGWHRVRAGDEGAGPARVLGTTSVAATRWRGMPATLSFRAEGEESPVRRAVEIPPPHCVRARDDEGWHCVRARDDEGWHCVRARDDGGWQRVRTRDGEGWRCVLTPNHDLGAGRNTVSRRLSLRAVGEVVKYAGSSHPPAAPPCSVTKPSPSRRSRRTAP